MIKTTKPRVSLLIGNPQVAGILSDAFKRMGILADYYASLRDFGQNLIAEQVHLAFVDVTMIRDGDYLLKFHPEIKAENVMLIYYHPQGTEALYGALSETFNFGHLQEGPFLLDQLHSTLKRVNRFLELQNQRSELQGQIAQKEERGEEVWSLLDRYKEREILEDELFDFLGAIERRLQQVDFFTALKQECEAWTKVRYFTVYSLSSDGKKIVTLPQGKNDALSKYRFFPALWPGNALTQGLGQAEIEFVRTSLEGPMQENLYSVKICDARGYVQHLLLIQLHAELPLMRWKLFEQLLSAYYLRYELNLHQQKEMNKDGEVFLGPWELWESSQSVSLQKVYGPSHLFAISCKKLVNAISKTSGEFYWSQFYRRFRAQLLRHIPFKCQVANVDLEQVALLVFCRDSDFFESDVQRMLQNFPYWKFFSDPEAIITCDLTPEIKMIPSFSHFTREEKEEVPHLPTSENFAPTTESFH